MEAHLMGAYESNIEVTMTDPKMAPLIPTLQNGDASERPAFCMACIYKVAVDWPAVGERHTSALYSGRQC